ncbi:hypothetical protein Trydic_g3810 [Trypoxylus dichotomus]
MWPITFVTYLAFIIQSIFVTTSIAAGLYYLAELVEEYTVLAKKCIWWTNLAVLVLYLSLWIFEKFPFWMTFFGIVAQVVHFGIILIVINHCLAFTYFNNVLYSFSEVMAYFTLFLWLVPFALLISLSANENVLPTSADRDDDGRDIVTNYFSKKNKKYGLLAFFSYTKESLMPQHHKKRY